MNSGSLKRVMNQPLNNPVRTPTRRLIVRRPTPEMRIGKKVYADHRCDGDDGADGHVDATGDHHKVNPTATLPVWKPLGIVHDIPGTEENRVYRVIIITITTISPSRLCDVRHVSTWKASGYDGGGRGPAANQVRAGFYQRSSSGSASRSRHCGEGRYLDDVVSGPGGTSFFTSRS